MTDDRLDLPQGTETRRDVEEIAATRHRAAGLTRQLLSFSRRRDFDASLARVRAALDEGAGIAALDRLRRAFAAG